MFRNTRKLKLQAFGILLCQNSTDTILISKRSRSAQAAHFLDFSLKTMQAALVCAVVHLLHYEYLAHLGDSRCLHACLKVGRIHEGLHLLGALMHREYSHDIRIVYVAEHLERDFARRFALLYACVVPLFPLLVILDLESNMQMCNHQMYLLTFLSIYVCGDDTHKFIRIIYNAAHRIPSVSLAAAMTAIPAPVQ